MKNSGFVKFVKNVLFDWSYFPYLAIALLVCDGIASYILIQVSPYRDANWSDYNAHADGFLNSVFDYSKLQNSTASRIIGPAGYVYLSSVIHLFTGTGCDIERAQYIWGFLYLATLAVVFLLLERTRITPPWAAFVLCCSKQLHSLYVLQLYNDSWAMILVYLAILFFVDDCWTLGTLLYCGAVSINLGVLHYLPGVVCLLLQRFGFGKAIIRLIAACLVQFLIAWPFLYANYEAYLDGVFDVPRHVQYAYSVSWLFIPKDIILSRSFAIALHCCRFFVLFYIAIKRWWPRLNNPSFTSGYGKQLPAADIVMTMFTSNYIGIVFSAHMEAHFYTWFFHSLPFLAWVTPYIAAYCLTVLFNIEFMFNAVPATQVTSLCLFGTNLLFLWIVTRYYKEELDYVCPLNGKRSKSKNVPKEEQKPKKE